MRLVSIFEQYSLAFQTNSTIDGAIVYPLPTVTPPGLTSNGDGIIACLGPDGVSGVNAVRIVPFGVGTVGTTMLVAVFGWTPTTGNKTVFPVKRSIWIATTLCTFGATLGSVAGLLTTDVADTQSFAGSLTGILGNTNFSVDAITAGGNTVCNITVGVKDAHFVEIRLSINGSSTSCNALYQRV